MKNEEQHILVRAIKEYWPIIFAVTTLVTTVSLYGTRLAHLEDSVSAKADKEIVEVKLDSIKNTLTGIDLKVNRLIELHLEK